MFINRVPMEREHSARATGLSIHVCLPESPKKEPSYKMGKNIRSPSVEPYADRRPTCNGVRPGSSRGSGAAWFLKGIVNDTVVSTSVPCSPLHDTFHLGLGRPEARQPACCSNPQQGIPSTLVTTSHMTQGRVECESTITGGTGKRLDLWEVK